ncbi:MAG TPA: hypothetical protein VII76_01045 [Acidimicrobiales bacterium]
MDHDPAGPDRGGYPDAVASRPGGEPDADDLPGGLYDDAVVVIEDVTGPGDASTVDDVTTDELDIDGSLLDSIEQELADVERALALLDEGTYGQCEHCTGAIDDEVLAATPTSRFCTEHLPLSLR